MRRLFILQIHCFLVFIDSDALHINGVWDTSNFFHYVTRFGFQKVVKNKELETQGYVYGNISSVESSSRYTFAIIHEHIFPEFYEGREHYPENNVCQQMLERLDCDMAVNSTEGILGGIPVVTTTEDGKLLVGDSMFTYPIRERAEPRFWFLSMVACQRVSPCHWEISRQKEATQVRYSVWLVNGSPDSKHLNPFEHQFSFDEQDVIEIYLSFLLAYIVLLPIQTWAHGRQTGYHLLPRVLTIAIGFELGGIFLNLVHYLKFASDGVPVDPVRITGNLLDSFGQSCLMLVLILVARGQRISARPPSDWNASTLVFVAWAFASVLYAILFAWNLVEEDEINDIDQWSTWPGYLALALRMIIAIWFIYDLTRTFTVETCEKRMHLYLHVGAGFLVWFVYLPIVALVCSHISALNRFKTILCISYAADFIAFATLVHLFWPCRSSVLHDFHVDAASTSGSSKAVSIFNFLFSANNDATNYDDDDEDDDDSGVCQLIAAEERPDGGAVSPVSSSASASTREEANSESPTTTSSSASSASTRRGFGRRKQQQQQQRRRDTQRERFISNSVYGVEEVDHSLIAELLEEDNRHTVT